MKALLSILFLFTVLIAQSQSDELRAKAEYFSAEEAYNAKNYTKCLEHLNNVDKILGETNVRVLYLRTKAGFGAGDYMTAKKAMDEFFNRQTSGNEFLELMSLSNTINKEYDKIIKEQNDYEYANRTNNTTVKINFINTYPNSKYKKTITDQLDALLWAKARETNREFDYENYVKYLPNGRNINKANEFLDFKKAMRANTIQDFEDFKKKYPRADSIRIVDQKLQSAYMHHAEKNYKENKYDAAINFCNKYTSTYPNGKEITKIREILQASHYYIGEGHRARKNEASAKASYTNAMNVKKTGTYYTKSHERMEEYRLNVLRVEKQGYYNNAIKHKNYANEQLGKGFIKLGVGALTFGVGVSMVLPTQNYDSDTDIYGAGLMVVGVVIAAYSANNFNNCSDARKLQRKEMQKYNRINVAYAPYYDYKHSTVGLTLNINF